MVGVGVGVLVVVVVIGMELLLERAAARRRRRRVGASTASPPWSGPSPVVRPASPKPRAARHRADELDEAIPFVLLTDLPTPGPELLGDPPAMPYRAVPTTPAIDLRDEPALGPWSTPDQLPY